MATGRYESPLTQEILSRIAIERKRQDELWGIQNHDPYKWLTILIEELGEVSQDFLKSRPIEAMEEMIQSAAVIVAWIECTQRQLQESFTED